MDSFVISNRGGVSNAAGISGEQRRASSGLFRRNLSNIQRDPLDEPPQTISSIDEASDLSEDNAVNRIFVRGD